MHAAPQQQPPAKSSRSGVKAALFAGSFLLFFGMSAMVASMVEGVVWWQYWPLIFVILGIVGMVVPAKRGIACASSWTPLSRFPREWCWC